MPLSKPMFSGRIELGHIIQVLALVITVSGGILASYIGLQSRISSLSERVTQLQEQLVEQAKGLRETREDAKSYGRDTAALLSKIGDQLTDLRIQIASRGKDGTDGPTRR